MQRTLGFGLRLVVGWIILGSFCLSSLSNLTAQERAQRQELGSSLDWLKWDPKKKAAVETRGPKGKRLTPADDTIRLDTMMVVFDMLVIDKQGRFVTGLSQDDFVVTEDGKDQTIASFSPGDSDAIPRSIIMIIDYSGSQRPYIHDSVEAAKTLVDQLKPKDRMAIVTDDVSLLLDFTSDKEALKAGLDTLRKMVSSGRTGRSEQYSALLATLREMVDAEARPIIIFQTDGDELRLLKSPPPMTPFSSAPPSISLPAVIKPKEYSFRDIYAAAERSRTTIYSVIPSIQLVGLPLGEQVKRARAMFEKEASAYAQAAAEVTGHSLRKIEMPGDIRPYYEMRLQQQTSLVEIAKLTGGWAEYLETPAQAAEIYSRILLGINRRYLLTYYPANTEHDGKLRKVKIEVRGHPEYEMRGRKSYYGPEREK